MSKTSDSSAKSDSPSTRPWLWAGVIASIASLVTGCKTAPEPAADRAALQSYRQDAARHLYALNSQRIYHGMLPPMLYAVGVLQLEIDRQGRIRRLHWMRAPRHAPEVIAEIERTVRAAAPFPAPARLDKITYTETWLWDQSGKFQLDTLTEGQRGQ